MQSLLERTWLESGSTAMLVTHDVEEAVTLADRVVAIDDGRITLELTVALNRPRLRDSPPFAALAAKVLDHVMGGSRYASETRARRDCSRLVPAGTIDMTIVSDTHP
jgi:sulfonate transport system ATP-binding protein